MAIIKKRFFEVKLPIIDQKVEVQEISPEKLDGKTIKIDLTRKLRGKSFEIIFKLKVKEDEITANVKRLHLFGYYIRRMMRKAISYVEDSFSIECKDAIIKIKPFLITRKKVSRKVRNVLRIKSKEEIENEVKNKTFNEILDDIIANKLQRTISTKLKKIYPLAFYDIRDIAIEKLKEVPKKETKAKEKVEPSKAK